MNIDQIIAAWRTDGVPYGTHYENCAEHHARCAIAVLSNQVEKLEAELATAMRIMGRMHNNIQEMCR